MSAGTYISVLGHAGLLGWALIGMSFQDRIDEPAIQVTEVSVISTEAFEIMMSNDAPDAALLDVALPAPNTAVQTPDIAVQEDQSPQNDVPQTALQTPPDDVPQTVPDPLPRPVEAPQIDVPEPVFNPAPFVPQTPNIDTQPPAQNDRVAPTPVAAPPDDVTIDRVPQIETAPTAEPTPDAAPAQEAAAQEAANTRIVTEAEAGEGDGPPKTSLRPQTRPAALRPEPEPQPAQEPEPTAAAQNDAINSALAEALAGGAPSNATLSVAESEGLTLAIQQCWSVGYLSTQALSTTVVVAVEFTQDGRPLPGSLRMVEHQGGTAASAQQAFIAARNAILECGERGYDLPMNIYDTWRYMELVFNPENMRIK
ncbi:MAG: energy transducer TonB [Planktomarina sp.]